MRITTCLSAWSRLLLALLTVGIGAAGTVGASTTDIAQAPLITSAASSVLPNLIFVLDDSGSMDYDYLPDWAVSSDLTRYYNSDYNSIYYNPAITYSLPVAYNSDGTRDTTSYPSRGSPWTSVKNDGYGIQSTASSNLVGSATFYVYVAGEYCTDLNLKTCITASSASAGYPYAAKLRWCDSNAMSNCQAVRIETGTNTFMYARTPGDVKAATATLTVGNSGTTSVSGIKVNGLQILSASTGNIGSTSTMASTIVNNINSCTAAATGNCGIAGYSAARSGSTITITAPTTLATITYTPAVTKSGNMTFTASAFSGGSSVPGSVIQTNIVSGTNSYPYPGTSTKASTRTDCAGSTCTYIEEMTNYANWWSYYHTRMQMMKSSASIAFSPLSTRYRLGYMSINNNTTADFLNIDTLTATQKALWYGKLFAAKPNSSTPLRAALTKTGRLFAGKLNGTTLNKSTVVDPMQYSCQQNFTILSTDGYWNESNPGGYQLNGTTAIGDQDSSLSRPQKDGNSTSNTLADVAAYYYNTDLRTTTLNNCSGAPVSPATTGNDVCANNVPASGKDKNSQQHMTTFTVGLGASGYMQFSPSYETAVSGDYFSVLNGTTANQASGICSWQTSGACNWPVPVSNTQTTIDDLWHAAVNGYGSYFSASTPSALSSGLSSALAGVAARTGDAAAATTSNPNVATGDNFVFSSTFTSGQWDGELVRQQLDLVTGVISSTVDWSAQTLLDTNTSRTIYTFDPSTTNKLKLFTWANLTSEAASFNTPNIATLSQFCASGPTCLSSTSQTAAAGANLVAFLRGDRSNEGASSDISKYYRQRSHVLGDIVNSEAVYVKTPQYSYTDTGYSTFQATSRAGAVYVAANDGMLHAFDATSGAELWAYVPSLVIPNLYKLADKSYSSAHSYFTDGTPVQGDVYFGGAWHTILVAGLNGGGRGYYALDVTDPSAPKALWEFTYDTSKGSSYTSDANLGYSFGKPEITKLKDGTWVVLVTSGYNNVSPGDGQGYLYVLNAGTGAKVGTPIGTGVGSTSTPSGLAQIRTWVANSMYDNTALRVYGGDLLGNLWRFDIDDNIAPAGNEAQVLATVHGSTGLVQPIMAKPELGDVSGVAVVYFGTGRYLGVSDLSDNSPQTLYAIKDNLGTTSFGNPRASTHFIQQTLTATTCPTGSSSSICTAGQTVRTSTSLAVSFATDYGWYVDLLDTGERATTDPQLQLGTLGYTTDVLDANACTVGGYSYQYFFDYRTGAAVSTSTTGVVGSWLGSALATRPVYVRLPNNQVVSIVRLSDGSTVIPAVPIGSSATSTRRLSWRELRN